MALMSYAVAVSHLRQDGVLDGSPEDPDIRSKMEQASRMTEIYLQRFGEWDEHSDPDDDREYGLALSISLQVLGWLYRYRGDETNMPGIETILNLNSCGMLKDRVLA